MFTKRIYLVIFIFIMGLDVFAQQNSLIYGKWVEDSTYYTYKNVRGKVDKKEAKVLVFYKTNEYKYSIISGFQGDSLIKFHLTMSYNAMKDKVTCTTVYGDEKKRNKKQFIKTYSGAFFIDSVNVLTLEKRTGTKEMFEIIEIRKDKLIIKKSLDDILTTKGHYYLSIYKRK
jgi:hypothetical protein